MKDVANILKVEMVGVWGSVGCGGSVGCIQISLFVFQTYCIKQAAGGSQTERHARGQSHESKTEQLGNFVDNGNTDDFEERSKVKKPILQEAVQHMVKSGTLKSGKTGCNQ